MSERLLILRYTLNADDIRKADKLGFEEEMDSRKRGSPHRAGGQWSDEDSLRVHVFGARGQQATASRLCGIVTTYPGAHNTVPDVRLCDRIDANVRTRSLKWHDLIVRPECRRDLPYILSRPVHEARSEAEGATRVDFEVVGWIEGERAMQPCYWKNPARAKRGESAAAYFVPQDDLHSIEGLFPIPALIVPGDYWSDEH